MDKEQSDERVKKIEERQEQLERRVNRAERNLYELLLSYWNELREKPARLAQVWRRFVSEEWNPLFSQFALDIDFILQLNERYFAQAQGSARYEKSVRMSDVLIRERFGLDEKGKLVPGGYLDSISQDGIVRRQVSDFLYRTRKRPETVRLRDDMKTLIRGTKDAPGLVSRYVQQHAYDTYQQADRLAQNVYAEELELPAAIYVGGIIRDSRDFCRERNSKIFIREEIARFGTPADSFGGYSNKSAGRFNGKPKVGYDPFTQCGGYGCRHHLSWIMAEMAVRMDGSLVVVDGALKRVTK